MGLTKVLIVRHGQTDHNKKGIMQGQLDVALNETGEAQAKACARWIKQRYSLDAIYTSQLARAYTTAQAIAALQNCEVVREPELQEIDVGEWQGLTYPEARERDPEVWQKLAEEPVHTKRPGGESFWDLYQRTTRCVAQLVQHHPDQTICLVTHGGSLRALLAYVLDVPPAPFGFRLTLDNTGVSICEYVQKHKRWQVHTINTTCHLTREEE